jgi:hypothetical protein
MKSLKKVTPVFLPFILIAFVLLVFYYRGAIEARIIEWRKQSLPEEVSREKAQADGEILLNISTIDPTSDIAAQKLLLTQVKEINLDVPFSPQAPFADWGLPYQEACEETSALLVHYFLQDLALTPGVADSEILNLVAWQKENLGHYQHTTALETAQMLNNYFGYERVEVQYDISMDDIKSHVAAGRPVILPLAGRLLGNPYFRSPGPVYHMLVVKGFTEDGKFITNDVGTKRGENFAYDPDVLFNAIHDVPEGGDEWKHEKPAEYILTGRKAMIVVYPQEEK